MDYNELVKELRNKYRAYVVTDNEKPGRLFSCAADAIEELLCAAKKMHTWIFLNAGDEQKAYDECGLSDEMNAALGYGGRFEIKADPCADCVHYPPSSTDGKPCCTCDPANPLTNCHEARRKQNDCYRQETSSDL